VCLADRGVHVSGGPLALRQSHVPNGELIVSRGNIAAFIAFYVDTATAERVEPQLIQNAGHFGGEVQRQGAVTIIWTHPPASDFREVVEACAFR
jgi:hypothetical protein